MTPIDDLEIGQWYAITSEYQEEEFHPFFFPTPSKVNGKPLQLVSISLPFLCMTDGFTRFPLDVRTITLQKLDKAYVKAMKARAHETRSSHVHTISEPAKKPKETIGRWGNCPLCGTRLHQRLDAGTWILACRECDFEGKV